MQKRRISISDIAKQTKLSKASVSFALRNSPMVSKQTRKKVQEVAKEMGYQNNAVVSSLMSKLRKKNLTSFVETIAIVNGNSDEFALERHPTLPTYYQGIKKEANRLGYAINEFWLHSDDFKRKNIARIFHSRGIRGGIILGHTFGNEFPKYFEKILHEFYFVSAGIRTYNQSLEVVASDDFLISYKAFVEAVALGYKRIAIVLDEYIDDLVGGTLIGGFLRAQLKNKKANIPPFMESEQSPYFKNALQEWVEQYKPDAILFLLNTTREILKNISFIKKNKIKLIQLERRSKIKDWIGIEQNNDVVGRVAVRRLADMLNRNSTIIGENSNMITLIKPTWINENT